MSPPRSGSGDADSGSPPKGLSPTGVGGTNVGDCIRRPLDERNRNKIATLAKPDCHGEPEPVDRGVTRVRRPTREGTHQISALPEIGAATALSIAARWIKLRRWSGCPHRPARTRAPAAPARSAGPRQLRLGSGRRSPARVAVDRSVDPASTSSSFQLPYVWPRTLPMASERSISASRKMVTTDASGA